MISRRFFLAATASFALAPKFVAASDEVPKMLDHILLGCNDLDRGIDFVEKHTGVRAAFGGVHPGRGTRNALLSLGERHYLEIIAPDPQQPGAPDHYGLLKLTEPRLVGWAAHPGDLNELATRLRNANIPFDGPNPGSRKRPDGRLLQWKTLNLKDDHSGLLPFFIEWSADTVHPSVDAPVGCSMSGFGLITPNDSDLRRLCKPLDLDLRVTHGARPELFAWIFTLRCDVIKLTSKPTPRAPQL
jgi:catechol 2,3-dioxygenase-like lactoylglutathione lyase family enzyme